jgi:hypothetical protein
MALLYCDGFDDYSNTTGVGNKLYELAPSLWTTGPLPAQNNHCVADTMPVLGTRGLALRWATQNSATNNAGAAVALPRVPANGDTLGFGFHFYMEELPSNTKSPFGLSLGGTGVQVNFALTNTGILEFKTSGPTGTALVAADSPLLAQVLYHIEAKITFGAADTGSFEVRVNGSTFMSGSGLTIDPTNRTHLGFGITASSAVGTQSSRIFFDNLFIWDDIDGDVTDFIGDRVVFTLLPDSDGSSQDWAPSTGSDGYDVINNVPPTGYISSTTPGDYSNFGMSDLSQPSHSIVGVQVNVKAVKTDAGDSEIVFGPEGALDGVAEPVLDQATYFTKVWERDPDTDASWSASGVQDLIVGIEKTA